jgi:hypothetical protein
MNAQYLAITILLLLGVSNAQAASFDLTGFRSQNGSVSIDLLADDGLLSGVATAADNTVGANRKGLGVVGLDGRRALGSGETLRIDFDQTINLGELHLTRFGRRDSVLVSWENGSLLVDDGSTAADEFRQLNLQSIDWITLTGQGNRKQFFVAGLNNVSAVPLPAAGWLFASAIGLMASLRRLKQKADKSVGIVDARE